MNGADDNFEIQRGAFIGNIMLVEFQLSGKDMLNIKLLWFGSIGKQLIFISELYRSCIGNAGAYF